MVSVLLVHHDRSVREVLKELLERVGYEVGAAADADKAIDLYRNTPPDLLIIDIVMTGKHDAETVRRLRRQFPGIKTIAISGGAQLGLFAHRADAVQTAAFMAVAENVGATAALPKPFSAGELLCTVQSLIEVPQIRASA